MELLSQLQQFVESGKAKDAEAAVSQAIEAKIPAKEILGAMCAGMSAVGEKFKKNEIYVPEVLIASRAMTKGMAILRPCLVSEGVQPLGKAVICTVKGDMHDIGKNLVKMMLEGSGIECVDIGTDASGEAVVNAVKESGAKLVCLSALLTTTMPNQGEIISALKEAGLRDGVKVMIGGAPVTDKYAQEIGADVYTVDAASCSEAAVRLLSE